MKKMLLIFLCFYSMLHASNVEGFKDMKWGDSPNKLGKYVVDKKFPNENKIICKRASDELKIGDAKLNAIFYEFYADKLLTIAIKFEGLGNLLSIKKAFETKYGAFLQPNESMEQYFLVNGGEGRISIMCSSDATNCYAFITNIKLTEEAQAYKKSVASKGAKE